MRRDVILLILLLPALCWGRTWRVEKDGSGDFTVIQDALDVAADGDTVRLGPGRYTEWQWVTTDGWTERVYAHVKSDDLTLIGAGQDETIIGPASDDYDWHQESPKGIAVWGHGKITVESLQIEHVRDGVYCFWMGLDISQVTASGCECGVIGVLDGGTIVHYSALGNRNDGVVFGQGTAGVLISGSCFSDNAVGVSVNWSTDIVVSGCEFVDNYSSIVFGASSGKIENCTIRAETTSSHIMLASSEVNVERCDIMGHARRAISIYDGGILRGAENVLESGTDATIGCAGSHIDFHDNHILNAGGYSVKVDYFGASKQDTLLLDLRNNYWGTTDRDQIADWILDGHDIEGLETYVLFEPYLDQPTPNEELSWGELKELYR